MGGFVKSHTGAPSPWAGGSLTEDLKALSRQNINMDVATFRTLRTEAMLVRPGMSGQAAGGTGPQEAGPHPGAGWGMPPTLEGPARLVGTGRVRGLDAVEPSSLGALAVADNRQGAKASGSKPAWPEGRGGEWPHAGLDFPSVSRRPGPAGAGALRWHPQRLPGPGPPLPRCPGAGWGAGAGPGGGSEPALSTQRPCLGATTSWDLDACSLRSRPCSWPWS